MLLLRNNFKKGKNIDQAIQNFLQKLFLLFRGSKKFANGFTMFFSQDLNSDDADKVAILRVAGNLNLANAPLLENQIVDLISKEYGEQDEDQPSQIIIGTQKLPQKRPISAPNLN